MLSEERREEIWEQVADELYNKNFEFSELEMECEAEQEDPRWGMPMYMSANVLIGVLTALRLPMSEM